MIVFGPVPSRRLGQSLGINNIPPKRCSYSCIYCQVGRTVRTETALQSFYDPETIFRVVTEKISLMKDKGEVDYITFVSDGEPTLDRNLGNELNLLRTLPAGRAVISNSSLIWKDQVKDNLSRADWISLKVDAVENTQWQQINRPHGSLTLETILDNILAFRKMFKGILVTETMLVRDINDSENNIRKLRVFLDKLKPDISYLSVPIRPPAETCVRPPTELSLIRAHQILSEGKMRVETLIGYEGNQFAATGNFKNDILSITAVHPMREEAVKTLMERDSAEWSSVELLLTVGLLVKKQYKGKWFYSRKMPLRAGQPLCIRLE